jgi:hypothetical protein
LDLPSTDAAYRFVRLIRADSGPFGFRPNDLCDEIADFEAFFDALDGPIRNPTNLGWILHTFATLQLSAGVHFMQVSKWLGHSTFTLTLDVCGDWIPEQDGGRRTTYLSRLRPQMPAEASASVVNLFGRQSG